MKCIVKDCVHDAVWGSPYCQSCLNRKKIVKCQSCTSEYVVFPDNVQYDEYGSTIPICNDCLDKSKCHQCGKQCKDDQLLICSACEVPVTTMTCLACEQLDKVPDEDWFCESCRIQRQQEQTPSKKLKTYDDAMIGLHYKQVWECKQRLKRLEDEATKTSKNTNVQAKISFMLGQVKNATTSQEWNDLGMLCKVISKDMKRVERLKALEDSIEKTKHDLIQKEQALAQLFE